MLKKLTISAVLLSIFISQSTFAIDEVLAAKVIEWRRHRL